MPVHNCGLVYTEAAATAIGCLHVTGKTHKASAYSERGQNLQGLAPFVGWVVGGKQGCVGEDVRLEAGSLHLLHNALSLLPSPAYTDLCSTTENAYVRSCRAHSASVCHVGNPHNIHTAVDKSQLTKHAQHVGLCAPQPWHVVAVLKLCRLRCVSRNKQSCKVDVDLELSS